VGIEQFVGTWKLMSFEQRGESHEVVYPFGEHAIGVLYYDAMRNMAAQLGRSNRPAFASADMLRGDREETKAAFEGYVSYFGTYTVDEHTGRVIHHVKGCSFPNWEGQDQARFYEFSGGQLQLSTPPFLYGGSMITGVLVWERIG
jgi:hypothetical protein